MGNSHSASIVKGKFISSESPKFLIYWFEVVIAQSLFKLGAEEVVKPLTLVCKEVANITKIFIENNYFFYLQLTTIKLNERFVWYSPKKLKNVLDVENALLPSSVTELIFHPSFNKKVTSLPTSLTHITFGVHFNQGMNDRLPPSLTHLVLGNDFSMPIRSLPSSLTHIEFNSVFFDQPIDSFLPPNLTYLAFSAQSRFNHPINELPLKLTHLTGMPSISPFPNCQPDLFV
eukprot:TRINITY_DN4144_c0_g1_i1.p1 TRINITY_DN4144_c0_g1~~TRINITY_DN4144_c0_g1_i1.p1  ORF type:complete len:231 (-),score=25.14 TRINITY_DN4144_c0_g1_i1:543-1235(-)